MQKKILKYVVFLFKLVAYMLALIFYILFPRKLYLYLTNLNKITKVAPDELKIEETPHENKLIKTIHKIKAFAKEILIPPKEIFSALYRIKIVSPKIAELLFSALILSNPIAKQHYKLNAHNIKTNINFTKQVRIEEFKKKLIKTIHESPIVS
jgi:hypothetical protein